MRKQFPVDKWLEKHMGPGRTLLLVFLFLMVSCYYHPSNNVIIVLLTLVPVLLFGLLIWMFVWDSKHPYKPDFCKECGQAKPEKFEE